MPYSQLLAFSFLHFPSSDPSIYCLPFSSSFSHFLQAHSSSSFTHSLWFDILQLYRIHTLILGFPHTDVIVKDPGEGNEMMEDKDYFTHRASYVLICTRPPLWNALKKTLCLQIESSRNKVMDYFSWGLSCLMLCVTVSMIVGIHAVIKDRGDLSNFSAFVLYGGMVTVRICTASQRFSDQVGCLDSFPSTRLCIYLFSLHSLLLWMSQLPRGWTEEWYIYKFIISVIREFIV